jgi:hypothetical protein
MRSPCCMAARLRRECTKPRRQRSSSRHSGAIPSFDSHAGASAIAGVRYGQQSYDARAMPVGVPGWQPATMRQRPLEVRLGQVRKDPPEATTNDKTCNIQRAPAPKVRFRLVTIEGRLPVVSSASTDFALSIHLPDGRGLGVCGVGWSDRLGSAESLRAVVGSPKRFASPH